MRQTVCVGVGPLEAEIPFHIPWWERLKERNRLAEERYRPLRSFTYVEKDPCPFCDASFVHVVLLDTEHICRKCGNTFEFRG